MTISKNIIDVIDSEYREYSMYVIENRAIPSAIDGLKPVHRKLLYAMLDGGGKKVKIADLGGISKYNFHHGENSAIAAAIGMAQDWCNNEPLFTGHGNFGSRIVQEAAAPRYIFASLSKAFSKYFCDAEVAPKSFDHENPEPAFYLPIIPWVLVNGISGIAVGFATNILPRSPKDIAKSVASYIVAKDKDEWVRNFKPTDLPPTFPSFRGKVVHVADNQWKTVGVSTLVSKNEFEISELPMGWDREGYVAFLNDLVDSDKIRDYDDLCSEDGFKFRVKVSWAQKEIIEKDITKFFKLEKSHSENLTTIGHAGKLRIFDHVGQLIQYFVDYRMLKFKDKIDYDIIKLSDECEYMKDKIKFIQFVVNDTIDFRKTTRDSLLTFIKGNVTIKEHGSKYASIPLYECTTDSIESLKEKICEKEGALEQLKEITPEFMFKKRLSEAFK